MPEKKIKNYSSKSKVITITHGDGNRITEELINNYILNHLSNEILEKLEDSASFDIGLKNISFTTDSFVVDPIFFPGGDIGKLSVCGTINDLVTTGCTPYVLSLSLIIDEGFPLVDLERILEKIKTSDE